VQSRTDLATAFFLVCFQRVGRIRAGPLHKGDPSVRRPGSRSVSQQKYNLPNQRGKKHGPLKLHRRGRNSCERCLASSSKNRFPQRPEANCFPASQKRGLIVLLSERPLKFPDSSFLRPPRFPLPGACVHVLDLPHRCHLPAPASTIHSAFAPRDSLPIMVYNAFPDNAPAASTRYWKDRKFSDPASNVFAKLLKIRGQPMKSTSKKTYSQRGFKGRAKVRLETSCRQRSALAVCRFIYISIINNMRKQVAVFSPFPPWENAVNVHVPLQSRRFQPERHCKGPCPCRIVVGRADLFFFCPFGEGRRKKDFRAASSFWSR